MGTGNQRARLRLDGVSPYHRALAKIYGRATLCGTDSKRNQGDSEGRKNGAPCRRAVSCSNKHQPDYFNLALISFAICKCSRTVLAVLLAKFFTSGSPPFFASFSKAARSFSWSFTIASM